MSYKSDASVVVQRSAGSRTWPLAASFVIRGVLRNRWKAETGCWVRAKSQLNHDQPVMRGKTFAACPVLPWPYDLTVVLSKLLNSLGGLDLWKLTGTQE